MAGLLLNLVGGPAVSSAAGAAGTVGLIAATSATVYAFRKKIPHPTEFAPIGCCFLRGGCHDHEAMDVRIYVHEIENLPPGKGLIYMYAEAGRFDTQTTPVKVEEGRKSKVFERVYLHVRQKDPDVTVSIWQKGVIKASCLGSLKVNVQRDLVAMNWPQETWYTLEKEGRMTLRVRLSWNRVNYDANMPPLLEGALLKNREKGNEGKLGVLVDIDAEQYEQLESAEKLRFLSQVLEGPLDTLVGASILRLHFAAQEREDGKWDWKGWRSESAMSKGKPVIVIPFLHVERISDDRHSSHTFHVDYKQNDGTSERLSFTRVNRDRNEWSEALYEFTKACRRHYDLHTASRNPFKRTPGTGLPVGVKRRVRSDEVKAPLPVALKSMMEGIANYQETDDEGGAAAAEDASSSSSSDSEDAPAALVGASQPGDDSVLTGANSEKFQVAVENRREAASSLSSRRESAAYSTRATVLDR